MKCKFTRIWFLAFSILRNLVLRSIDILSGLIRAQKRSAKEETNSKLLRKRLVQAILFASIFAIALLYSYVRNNSQHTDSIRLFIFSVGVFHWNYSWLVNVIFSNFGSTYPNVCYPLPHVDNATESCSGFSSLIAGASCQVCGSNDLSVIVYIFW